MQRFADYFGFAIGLILAAHGVALMSMQSPLIRTSTRRGALLYFQVAESLFGVAGAWIFSGLLWLCIGGLLAFTCFPRRLPK